MKKINEVLKRMTEALTYPSKQDYVLAYSTSSISGGGSSSRCDSSISTGGKDPDPKKDDSELVRALKKLQEAISEVLKELGAKNEKR